MKVELLNIGINDDDNTEYLPKAYIKSRDVVKNCFTIIANDDVFKIEILFPRKKVIYEGKMTPDGLNYFLNKIKIGNQPIIMDTSNGMFNWLKGLGFNMILISSNEKCYTMDLGYKNDPTIIELVFPLKERKTILNSKSLTYNEVINTMWDLNINGKDTIMIQRSEPHTIELLRKKGFKVLPVDFEI